MKTLRIVVTLALLAVLASSCVAATLSVQATAPRYHASAAACSSDVASPMDSAMVVTLHFAYVSTVRGGAAGEDSVTTAKPGAVVPFEAVVPEGLYRMRAWASTGAGPQTCAPDTLTVYAGAVPGAARFVRP